MLHGGRRGLARDDNDGIKMIIKDSAKVKVFRPSWSGGGVEPHGRKMVSVVAAVGTDDAVGWGQKGV